MPREVEKHVITITTLYKDGERAVHEYEVAGCDITQEFGFALKQPLGTLLVNKEPNGQERIRIRGWKGPGMTKWEDLQRGEEKG